jgi:hypothetical protein
MSYQACVDAWLGDDMFAKAADVLPNEAFREPYEIQASGSGVDDSDQSRSDMRRAVRRARDLGVDAVLERAWAMERALGGAIIVLGINDGQAMSARSISRASSPAVSSTARSSSRSRSPPRPTTPQRRARPRRSSASRNSGDSPR